MNIFIFKLSSSFNETWQKQLQNCLKFNEHESSVHSSSHAKSVTICIFSVAWDESISIVKIVTQSGNFIFDYTNQLKISFLMEFHHQKAIKNYNSNIS